jgi:hypothetical protein
VQEVRNGPGVLDDIEPGGLYTLSGPRRIGKSLELRRAIAALIATGSLATSVTRLARSGIKQLMLVG